MTKSFICIENETRSKLSFQLIFQILNEEHFLQKKVFGHHQIKVNLIANRKESVEASTTRLAFTTGGFSFLQY